MTTSTNKLKRRINPHKLEFEELLNGLNRGVISQLVAGEKTLNPIFGTEVVRHYGTFEKSFNNNSRIVKSIRNNSAFSRNQVEFNHE